MLAHHSRARIVAVVGRVLVAMETGIGGKSLDGIDTGHIVVVVILYVYIHVNTHIGIHKHMHIYMYVYIHV